MKDSVLNPCFSALSEFQHEIVKFMTDKNIVLSGTPDIYRDLNDNNSKKGVKDECNQQRIF